MTLPIIIIGAGLAGLSAAYTCAAVEQKVILVSKLPSEQAQSIMAEGGINAALNTKGEGDTPEEHDADTLHAGCDLADPNAVWNLTHAAPSIVRQLAAWGVPFNRTLEGDIDLRHFGGQKKMRTAFVQSDTGKQLVTAFVDVVRRYEAAGLVKRLPHHEFQTLLLHDHTCTGCVVTDTFTGLSQELNGAGVIIATGGMHGLFGNTTGSLMNTGAVTAELFRLGLPLANGEMIQYHPTTVRANGKNMLISEAARGEGGRLYTLRQGKPWYFMEEKYPTLGNLMPRDITAREIAGLTSQGHTVYLDMSHLSAATMTHKLAGLVDDCRTYLWLDITKNPVPVHAGIHYFMGGLQVDENHRTPLKGLYAAGECAAQYHGANRLGGNSLLGAIYGGHIAAQTACAEGQDIKGGTALSVPPPLTSKDTVMLHAIMDKTLGIIRTEDTLRQGLQQIQELDGPMARLGEACIRSALYRHESRGAHYRSDYPQRDDIHCKQTTLATYDGTTIHITYVPIPERR